VADWSAGAARPDRTVHRSCLGGSVSMRLAPRTSTETRG
jgi:hypothetical protein